MSLSKHFQSAEHFGSIKGKSPEHVKEIFMEAGLAWFREHSDEHTCIRRNLSSLGLDSSDAVVEKVAEGVILHYYEKLLPFAGDTEYFHTFLTESVNPGRASQVIQEIREHGKGVILAVAHFGAVEFIAPVLSTCKLPITAILRFQTERLFQMAQERVRIMADSGLFGEIRFIGVGKPGTNAALEMAAALRRGEVLLAVFDERTDYSIPVDFFKRKVWGGAGLDKLMRFAGESAAAFNAFMVRESKDNYTLKLDAIDTSDASPVHQMYKNLENVVRPHVEQWYFLHEEIPFVADRN